MFGALLGGLIDKEKATQEVVVQILEAIAEELKCPAKDFFIMIRAKNDEFEHQYFICKFDEKGNPQKIREFTLKEVFEKANE